MAKNIYIGVGGVAKKVKKVYIGIGGVARKIKKAYIGIANVARCFFSGGEVEYVGAATNLTVARTFLAATTVGNYALFGGGSYNTSSNTHNLASTVDAYNTSLTRSAATGLSQARDGLAATTVGDYALFGGGATWNGTTENAQTTVNAYNTSLTRSNTTLSLARSRLTATTVGNYALFSGGYLMNNTNAYKTVDAFDTSLTRSTPTALSDPYYGPEGSRATTVGNYALFPLTYYSQYNSSTNSRNVVNAFNNSLTRSTPTALSVIRNRISATTVGNYALFGGGELYTGGYKDTVDTYNTSLTRSTATALSQARTLPGATTVGENAIFAGGGHRGYVRNNNVDAYDTSLTRSTPTALPGARVEIEATTVGDYALFGGGEGPGSSYTCSNLVEVYTA